MIVHSLGLFIKEKSSNFKRGLSSVYMFRILESESSMSESVVMFDVKPEFIESM